MIDDTTMTTETLEIEEEELEQEKEGPESVEDSARAVLEALNDESTETDQPSDGAAVQEGQKSTVDASEAARILANSKKPKKRKVVEASQLQGEPGVQPAQETALEPPARFPVEYKEKFHKLPRPVQEQALEFWNGMESNLTKKLQDASRYVNKYQQVDQLMTHYAPMFHEKGFTETQALAELFATWKNLNEKPVDTIKKIVSNLGIQPEQLFQESTQPQQQLYAQQGLTREDVARILEEREQQAQYQRAQESAVGEVQTLRNERDQNTGQYKYPELWDNSYLQRVQPLVKYHRETHPEISWAEATRRAVLTSRASLGASGSPSPIGTRLTPEEEIQKIKQASVSIRPRGNGAIPTLAQARPGESVKDSAEAILAEFRRH